jgi:hypothetical protein
MEPTRKEIPQEVIQDWVKNKKRIQDRLNRVKKRIKKYQKQEKHFELRMRLIKQYEQRSNSK